jgi:hypothetical protein
MVMGGYVLKREPGCGAAVAVGVGAIVGGVLAEDELPQPARVITTRRRRKERTGVVSGNGAWIGVGYES